MLKRIITVFAAFLGGVIVLFFVGYIKNYGKLPVTAVERKLIDMGLKRAPVNIKNYATDLSDEKLSHLEKLRATIHTNFGDITIKFYPREAPQTVQNFIYLVKKKGWYENTRFYHIFKPGAIEGGLRKDSKSKNAGYYIKDEVNIHKNTPGAVGMMRSPNSNDTGSCRFYICFRKLPQFDDAFTIFARTVEGMEVVNKIADLEVDKYGWPKEEVIIHNVSLKEVKG